MIIGCIFCGGLVELGILAMIIAMWQWVKRRLGKNKDKKDDELQCHDPSCHCSCHKEGE